MSPLIRVERLHKYFPRGGKSLKAVDDISLSIEAGETLGLVGESGSGKSTLGRTILQLLLPTSGQVFFEGQDLTALDRKSLRRARRHLQIIFQDPLASLNPQMSIGQSVEDGLIVHRLGTADERRSRVAEMLDVVGIGRSAMNAFPFQFSGGQQQRIGIARALVLSPKFVVCDEPVSALDVSIQAQIVALLLDLRQRYNLSYLFISHDLAVVKYVADRIAVMYLGRIVELGSKAQIFDNPQHPYTRALIASFPRIPRPGEEPLRVYETLKGEVPSPLDLPRGCRFRSRCAAATAACADADEPSLAEIEPGHHVACWERQARA